MLDQFDPELKPIRSHKKISGNMFLSLSTYQFILILMITDHASKVSDRTLAIVPEKRMQNSQPYLEPKHIIYALT